MSFDYIFGWFLFFFLFPFCLHIGCSAMALAFTYCNLKILRTCPRLGKLIPRTTTSLSKYTYLFSLFLQKPKENFCFMASNQWQFCAVWEHDNSGENIEGYEDRIREEKSSRGCNLYRSDIFPWPRWLHDRNLQLRGSSCDSTGWRGNSLLLTHELQYPTGAEEADSTSCTKENEHFYA